MGSINDLIFIKNNANKIKDPILEVGSRDYGNTQDIRALFPNFKWIGVDLGDGKGVDIVLDLTEDFDIVNQKLNGIRFKTIICFSVLEHVKNPFKMCNNLSKLLVKNGIILINVPFSWRIHGYPFDYWRFTPDGIKALFPDLEFNHSANVMFTGKIGEFKPIEDSMFRADTNIIRGLKSKRYGILSAILIYIFKKIRILPFIFDYPYLFPPVTINMIGKKI